MVRFESSNEIKTYNNIIAQRRKRAVNQSTKLAMVPFESEYSDKKKLNVRIYN